MVPHSKPPISGFLTGITGSEIAQEAPDIILMDAKFPSIAKAITWGRCANDAVRKFLQFQISTNITAVVITFVSTISSNEEESVLTAVQLLWINTITDTFAALALATDPASKSLLEGNRILVMNEASRLSAPVLSISSTSRTYSLAMMFI